METRKTVLTEHIRLDRNCLNDPFLCQFMEGRVEQEESWLEETDKLLTSLFEPKEMMETLQNRRAILKTLITDARNLFRAANGQTMRGKTAVNTHWLEETETIIDSLSKEII